jgi:hypothetical protein
MNSYSRAALATTAVIASLAAASAVRAADTVRGDYRTRTAIAVARPTVLPTGSLRENATLDYPHDRDCYAVEYERGRTYGVLADSGDAVWDVRVEVLDAQGRALADASYRSEDGGNDETTAFVERTASYTGRHVVCVSGAPDPEAAAAYGGGDYETLTFATFTECPAFADAHCNLRLGRRLLYQGAYFDEDGFNFRAEAGRTYTFRPYENRGYGWCVQVYSSRNVRLAGGCGLRFTGDALSWRSPGTGTARVVVSGEGYVWDPAGGLPLEVVRR